MTLLGIDVSDNNALDLNHVFDQGYAFVTARCVIGDYLDKRYPTFRDVAKARGKLFAAYVFPHTDVPWATTAALTRQWIGDPSIPIMLDTEPDPAHGSRPPTLADCAALTAALRAEGLKVVSFYSYDYFERTLGAVASLGLALVMANYGPNAHGHGSALYPGDASPRWGPYIEGPVSILQFGSNGIVDGYAGPVDLDAYPGTLDQLIASGLFTDWSDVTVTPAEIAEIAKASAAAVHGYPYVNPETKVNQPFESRVFEVASAIATHADTGKPSVKTMITQFEAALQAAVTKAVAPILAALQSAVADVDTRLVNLETKVENVTGPAGPPGPPGPAAVVDAAVVEAAIAGQHAEVTFGTSGSAT